MVNETKSQLGVFGMELSSSKELTSTTPSIQNSINSPNFNDDEEKCKAQILAAKRSLITNLVLTALCVLTNSLLYFFPQIIFPLLQSWFYLL